MDHAFKPDTVSGSSQTLHLPLPPMTLPDGTPLHPTRQEILDTNPLREQMPQALMRRPGFGKAGNQVQMSINSHNVTKPPMQTVYQYDVSCSYPNL